MENKYDLPEEVMQWLEENEAYAFEEPMIYGFVDKKTGVSHVFSEKYLRETPIEEIRQETVFFADEKKR